MTVRLPTEGHITGFPRAIPHIDDPSLVQMITFRLHDALPDWRDRPPELGELDPDASKLWFRRYDGLLDEHHGACLLGQPEAARIVSEAFQQGADREYALYAWVVMPNHVHVLIRTYQGCPLSEIVRRWKGGTAYEINKWLGRRGRIWQRDYYDRFMRNDRNFVTAVRYIEMNPVKAGLAEAPELYRWSSAFRRKQGCS